MPNRKSPIDTVQILLNHVTKVLENGNRQSNQANAPNPLLVSYQNIKSELEYMNDNLFPQFKCWDEALMKVLTGLETCIDDDDIFDNQDDDIFDNQVQNNKIQKIKSIDEKLTEIQELKTKIQLPKGNETSTQSQQQDLSEAKARKVSEDWARLKVEENILASPAMANLQLSYEILDIQVKICLLFLAIFPEKAVVKKKLLIYWWIGEGLISKSKDKSAEEVGEGIFMKLIEKGLIQPFHKGKDQKNPIVYGCTVHPWIRRMLIAVARRAEFFDFDDSGKIVEKYSKSRRACLVLGDQGFSGSNNSPQEEELLLFTIFNVNEQYLSFKPELFLKLKKLMVLQLGRWQTWNEHHIEVENDEFLNELRAQKHLRYLSLHGISRLTALPSSIAECVNLEILDLRACHNLERLPSDIGSLRKLTHLDVSQCYLLESMPKGIEKLSSLQVLKGFVIGHSRKNPNKLGDLAQLKKLRKLSIYIGSEAVIEDGELSKLKEIVSLRVLKISWVVVASPSKDDEQVGSRVSSDVKFGASISQRKEDSQLTLTMKSFSFPPKLEKLDLWCFPCRMSPEWLTPSNMKELKKLYIRGGDLGSLVSKENKKWKVTILRLKYLKNLKVEWSLLKEHFPDLVYFEKIQCNQNGLKQYDTDVEWSKAEGWEALGSRLKATAMVGRESQDEQDAPTHLESQIHEDGIED